LKEEYRQPGKQTCRAGCRRCLRGSINLCLRFIALYGHCLHIGNDRANNNILALKEDRQPGNQSCHAGCRCCLEGFIYHLCLFIARSRGIALKSYVTLLGKSDVPKQRLQLTVLTYSVCRKSAPIPPWDIRRRLRTSQGNPQVMPGFEHESVGYTLESLIDREATTYSRGVRWLVGCNSDVVVDDSLPVRPSTWSAVCRRDLPAFFKCWWPFNEIYTHGITHLN